MSCRVAHGPEPGTSFSRNLPLFWNRNGLESIFYLLKPEQELLNLRLILFIKGFLQLIAQFSSTVTYLQRARLLNVVNEFAFACQFRRHARTIFQKTKWTEVVFDKGKSSYLKYSNVTYRFSSHPFKFASLLSSHKISANFRFKFFKNLVRVI